MIIIEQIYTER